MKPIPVVFHIGPLQVHTYGIGLALDVLVRLHLLRAPAAQARLPDRLVPARLPLDHPRRRRGRPGLRTSCPTSATTPTTRATSSPSGTAGCRRSGDCSSPCPTGIVLTRRRCPELALGRALDLAAPGAHGLLGHGPAPRAAADGGRGRPSHPPVVRHVLRRTGGPAPARCRSSRPWRTSPCTWSSWPLSDG